MKRAFIFPGDPGHGVDHEKFVGMIQPSDLKKIEAILRLPSSKRHGFRWSLPRFLWTFYLNSLPETKIKVSRSVLKRELRKAATLSWRLENSAGRIWQSGDHHVIAQLKEFVQVGLSSQSSRPMHPSGIGFIDLLNDFALTTQMLAQTLSEDRGGPRSAMALDSLIIGLAQYYRDLTNDEPDKSSMGRFYRFIAAVVDMLRKLERALPAAKFNLPCSDKALTMRLRRLARG
jgi:hypothetical protein